MKRSTQIDPLPCRLRLSRESVCSLPHASTLRFVRQADLPSGSHPDHDRMVQRTDSEQTAMGATEALASCIGLRNAKCRKPNADCRTHSVQTFQRTCSRWLDGNPKALEMHRQKTALGASSSLEHPQNADGSSKKLILQGILGVADGARTHDNRNHNPGLYQLSYSHRCSTNYRLLPSAQRPAPNISATTVRDQREITAKAPTLHRQPS